MSKKSFSMHARRALLTLSIAALAGGFSGVATASSDGPPPSPIQCSALQLEVTAVDTFFRRYLLNAQVGDVVTVSFTNAGESAEEPAGAWGVQVGTWDAERSRVRPGSWTILGEGTLPDTYTYTATESGPIPLEFFASGDLDTENHVFTSQVNVRVSCENAAVPPPVTSVPTLSSAGLLATGGMVVLVAGYLRRRRRGRK